MNAKACIAAAFLHFLFLSGSVSAQCPYFLGGEWPREVVFEPAMPVAGDSVDVILGPPASISITPYTVSMSGRDIFIDGNFYFEGQIGTTPPPHLSRVPLGQLAGGDKTVHIRLTVDGGSQCPDLAVPLTVAGPGAAAAPIPASSLLALTCLIFGIFTIGWINRHRVRASLRKARR